MSQEKPWVRPPESVIRARMQAMREKERARVASGGFNIHAIFPTQEGGECFAYTSGLDARGLPELIVTGNIPAQTAAYFIHAVVDHWMKDVANPKLGRAACLITLGADGQIEAPITLVEVDPYYAHETYMFQVEGILGKRATRVVQLICPDPKGAGPDEPGFDEAYKQTRLPLIQ